MAEHQKKKRLPLASLLILAAACGVFLYSASQLWAFFSANRENERQQQMLIDQAVAVLPQKEETLPQEETAPNGTVSPEESETAPVITGSAPIYVDFEVLLAQNPDIVGWIYCEGTRINYPIVRGEDNQYYLNRMHTGESNPNGSIFMDFRNLPDFSDFNNLIYGHNMRDGAMFGTLRNYRDQAYYDAHPVMWLLTPDKAFRVDLIAGFVTPSDSDTYEIYSFAEDFHAGMAEAIAQSTFDPGEVDIEAIEHAVTLSTCTYEFATARYVVIGSLVEVGYPEPPETE